MREILIIKAGESFSSITERRGDFEEWIRAGMDVETDRIRVVRPYRGEPIPDPHDHSGIIITGSSAMVTDREAWSEGIASWLPSALESGTPLLGICYGHQLLAHATGGIVGAHPPGGEMGTVEIHLAEPASRDPLFTGFPSRFHVQSSHFQSVLTPPEGTLLLAASDRDPSFALAYSDRAWGIQFHPEFDAEITSRYIEEYDAKLRDAGFDPAHLMKSVRETPRGREILLRFAEIARKAADQL